MPPRPSEAVRMLQRDGWTKKSQSGSHAKLVKDGRIIIVSMHRKELSKGTWEGIREQAGWK
jgi:predicted RNA binding protein YcfA (HicA-like mRNA interferase family)